jgi:predicted small metal-binding protein
MKKVFRCGDLMPGCGALLVGASVDDILEQATRHVREVHGMASLVPSWQPKPKQRWRTSAMVRRAVPGVIGEAG